MNELERAIAELNRLGATEDEIAAFVAEFVAEFGGDGITPRRSKFTSEQLVARADRQVQNAREAEGVDDSTGAVRALGTVASLARDIPGAEAAQAGARAGVRTGLSRLGLPVMPEGYREALANIRGAGAAAPAYTRIPARLAGGVTAGIAIPGGPALQGARYGMLAALGNAEPASAEDRLQGAAAGMAVGALAGTAVPRVVPAIRGIAGNARAIGDAAIALSGSRSAQVRTARRVGRLVWDALPDVAAQRAPAPAGEVARLAADEIERRLIAMGVPAVKASAAAQGRRAPAMTAAPAVTAGGGAGAPGAVPGPAASVGREEAARRLAALLQRNLDEGAVGERVKGYPIKDDPPTNRSLMDQIERGLAGGRPR